jgi:DNA-directed RNA polymerase sigma subunit (sigma70/sigma32)
MHSLQRVPTLAELAAHTGLSVEEVEQVMTDDQPPLSLEALCTHEDHCLLETLIDAHAPDPIGVLCEQEQEHEMRHAVQMVLCCLTLRERQVVTCKFGLDGNGERTTLAICRELGLCQSRVYQLLTSALRKMRTSEHAHVLRRAFLDQQQQAS